MYFWQWLAVLTKGRALMRTCMVKTACMQNDLQSKRTPKKKKKKEKRLDERKKGFSSSEHLEPNFQLYLNAYCCFQNLTSNSLWKPFPDSQKWSALPAGDTFSKGLRPQLDNGQVFRSAQCGPLRCFGKIVTRIKMCTKTMKNPGLHSLYQLQLELKCLDWIKNPSVNKLFILPLLKQVSNIILVCNRENHE